MPQDPLDTRALADLRTPWCLRVAVTLRIADRIAEGDAAHAGIADLAAAAGADPRVLEVILRHLVSRGVFEEPEPGRFALNVSAESLRSPATRLELDLDGIGGRFAHAWGTLLRFARTGEPAYAEAFGRPFWEDLDAHPALASGFDALMGPTGHGTPDADLPLERGWAAVRTVVDVGGGTGAMLAELLRRHPSVHGTLLDLPRTVERASELFEAAGVAGRASVVGQSFFDPLPAGADVYLLKSVLNDWPDRETVAILSRCADAARPDGRIIVLAGVTPDDAPAALGIDMLVTGGRSNSLAEFRALAAEAGLEVAAATRQPSGRFVVECRPI